MKSVLKLIKIVSITIVSGVILLAVVINIIDIPGEKKEKLFRKIKPGMSADQVINILGRAAGTHRVDSMRYVFDYSSEMSGKSTEPEVTFDTANRVIDAFWGD